METLLTIVLFLPLAGAILVALLPRGADTLPRSVAAAVSLLTLLLTIVLFLNFKSSVPGFQFETNVPWIPQIGVSYHIGLDGISTPLLLLNSLLTFLAVLTSWDTLHRPKLYYFLVLTLQTAVAGVFSSLDFFLFFLFWELELAPMFLLIGIWGGARREYAAFKFIIYTILGSAFMLVGILALYFGAGQVTGTNTFDMVRIGEVARQFALPFQLVVFALLYIGFAVKIPIFPFHTWLPDAHTEAPTAISVLLAGVLLKMGGYGLLRVCVGLLPDAARVYAPYLVVLAVVSVLYGAYVALAQRDLKRLIANSSISHMGYVVLGISALSQIGFQGAVLQMFTHGTITGLLFMMIGLVYDRTHTRQVDELGGLGKQMPFIAAVFYMAGLASLGLPGMSGFVAEFLVFIGTFPVWQTATILAAFCIVITAGYILLMLGRTFMGPPLPRWDGLGDANRREAFTVLVLTAVIIVVGLFPNLIVDMIAAGVAPLVGRLSA